MDEKTDVGPLATEQQRADIVELVDDAVAKGADGALRRQGARRPRVVLPAHGAQRDHPGDAGAHARRCSGRWPPSTGWPSIEEAIELANGTDFGLGSNAWTNDEAERERLITELKRAWSSSTAT